MTKSAWARWALTPIAMAMLTSCALQRVNESFDRSEYEGRTAGNTASTSRISSLNRRVKPWCLATSRGCRRSRW